MNQQMGVSLCFSIFEISKMNLKTKQNKKEKNLFNYTFDMLTFSACTCVSSGTRTHGKNPSIHPFLLFCFLRFIWGKELHWEGEKVKDRGVSVCWFAPWMTMPMAWNSFWMSHMNTVAQALGPAFAVLPDILTGSWIRSGGTRTWAGTNVGCCYHGQWLGLLHDNRGNTQSHLIILLR